MPQKMDVETYVTRLKFVFLNIKKNEGGGGNYFGKIWTSG